MNTLNGTVELKLSGCKKLEKLPALWLLPALEILHVKGLESLHCLCSGAATAVTFQKLKVLTLVEMPNVEAWLDTDVVQGEGPIFPEVEELVIRECGSLTALPKAASVTTESSGVVDTKCRSAFPALRNMTLRSLNMFDRWETVEGTPEEEVTFPLLEDLEIDACLKLTGLPETPKLGKLAIGGEGQQISLQAASRCIPSLSSLRLDVSPDDTETTLLHVKQKWDHELPLAAMMLIRCDLLFFHPGALALWTCFARLVDLTIRNCDALVYWPENVFQVLVSLRRLSLWSSAGSNEPITRTQQTDRTHTSF
jgi:hypothetical protein